MFGLFKKIFPVSITQNVPTRFSIPNYQAIEKKLDFDLHVKKKRTKNQEPANNCRDDFENKIISEFETLKAISDNIYTKNVELYCQRIATCDVSQVLREVEILSTTIPAEFEMEKNSNINKTYVSYEKYKDARKALSEFKAANKLESKVVTHSGNQIFKVGILLFILCLETICNGYFFSIGNDYGLLGGAFQALIVSAINIIIGFMLGTLVITSIIHVKLYRKLIGLSGLLLWIGFILSYNILVVHYRNISATGTTDNIGQLAWNSFLSNPFNINDFNSALLAILGLVCSVISMLDGFFFSEPYPGFAKINSHFEDKAKEYSDNQERTTKALRGLINTTTSQIQLLQRKITNTGEGHGSLLNRIEQLNSEYIENISTISKMCNGMLSAYRAEISNGTPHGKPENELQEYIFTPVELYVVDHKSEDRAKSIEKINATCNDLKEKLTSSLFESIQAIKNLEDARHQDEQ